MYDYYVNLLPKQTSDDLGFGYCSLMILKNTVIEIGMNMQDNWMGSRVSAMPNKIRRMTNVNADHLLNATLS